MEEEIWKSIPEFEKYQVSNLGRIKGTRFNIIKPYLIKGGYEIVSLSKNGVVYKKLLHRLITECFVSNPNNYNVVDHINRNKCDNRCINLRWVTNSQNSLNNPHREKEMFGLRWHKRGNGYYEIRFTVDGKERSFGTARTLEEAKQKRDDVLK